MEKTLNLYNFLNPQLLPKINCKSACMDNYEVKNLIHPDIGVRSRGFMAFTSIKPPVNIEFEFICPIQIEYVVINATVGSQRSCGLEIFIKLPSKKEISISKAIFENEGVIFCNSKYYSKDNLPPNVNSNYHVSFFNKYNYSYLLNCDKLYVRIIRTSKSVPCLSSVEIWGKASRQCSEVTKKSIVKLMCKNVEISPSTSQNQNNFKIPEDFKDNLTLEIMTVPMTLPSGHTIDRSTLDKHIEEEKKYGRKPGDPFTGLKFTNDIKPVLNVPLKSRIDMFILQNSTHFEDKKLNRTVGRGNCNSITAESFNYNSLTVERGNCNLVTTERGNCNLVTVERGNCDSNKRKAEVIASLSEKRSKNENVGCDKLEIAIQEAKRDKNFVSFTDNEIDKNCGSCKKDNDNYLYELPCSHYSCRSCLLKTMICNVCKIGFLSKDVKKINI